ncbi:MULTISPECIES: hypothetical protein [unclassified Methylobacterium]|uniref:hypothetical protein n=1 Tax=unclassified Methylobacterium TaxID=2615210 RepID=UPI0002E53F1F|nr:MULTISPECIES: hypothetical protein [Methylobacterium]WFT81747.1 hypothetical protein QA634_07775 [Methylobacterium nodulans]
MANLLADRIFRAHMAGEEVPDAHMSALITAGLLLDAYGMDVPPLLIPIMDQIRSRAAAEAEAHERADGGEG